MIILCICVVVLAIGLWRAFGFIENQRYQIHDLQRTVSHLNGSVAIMIGLHQKHMDRLRELERAR